MHLVVLTTTALHSGQCKELIVTCLSFLVHSMTCASGFCFVSIMHNCACVLEHHNFICHDNPPSPAVNAGEPEQRAPACSNNGWQTLQSNGTSMIGPNSWAEQAVSVMRKGLLACLQFQTRILTFFTSGMSNSSVYGPTISIYKVSKHSRCSKQVLQVEVRTNVPSPHLPALN